MLKAKVTEVLTRTVVLAEAGDVKGIRVSVPVNVNAPEAGADINISDVETVAKADAKGYKVNIQRAVFLGKAGK
jgi:hypothetical protein